MSIRRTFNEKVDLAWLVNQFGVELVPFGDDDIGKCPFSGCHQRCFVVRQLDREYECLSCGSTGDAIDFMVKAVGFIREQAIELLMELFTIQIDDLMPPKQMPVWHPKTFVVD